MSSWGNNDNAANVPLWAAASVFLAPTSANTTALFDNVTQDAFVANATIGVFGVDAQEAGAESAAAHTGWVLRTVGVGGRAGRIQEEVLVAMNTMTGDSDGQVYANVAIVLSGPSNASVLANTAYANSAVFTVIPTLTGNTSSTLTYQWQVNNGGSWTNAVNDTPANTNYAGATTATLSVKPADATVNNFVFRAIVTAADQGVTATSANGKITVA